MTPLQITLLTIVVLVAVTFIITYFVRNRYYEQIDKLNKEKSDMLSHAPYDELKEVDKLNLTGQSLKIKQKLQNNWKNIESIDYPKIENYLYDAEQATDNYRLGESKKNQDAAKESIESTNKKIKELKDSLVELIEREQANLKKIDTIKKRYHDIRKSLLAYSFSFGPASESFEQNLNNMEEDFTNFSELTLSGDHEEAKEIINNLNDQIEKTEKQMEQIPPILTKINDIYEEQLEDLNHGYSSMIEEGYLFPDDTILEDIENLKDKKNEILNEIKLLEIGKAEKATESLGDNIEQLYQKMEKEVEVKPKVPEMFQQNKQAMYYLRDENRRLDGVINRISQSYELIHNEETMIRQLEEQVMLARTDFEKIESQLNEKNIPYSVAYSELKKLFEQLHLLHKDYQRLSNYLSDYREKELELKSDMSEMEQAMYEMKRALENERLPGLPEDYLELFFSTSNRIEKLADELARPRINLIKIQKLYEMCEEDVIQLSEFTEEIIKQVELTELASQRLYRYKDSHKGILETIRYSESIFNNDYDYDTALRLVREKLENVDPGSYEKVLEEYEKEMEQEV